MSGETRRRRARSTRRSPTERLTGAISLLLIAASAAGVALTMLGYGMSLQLNAMFGPDVSEVLRGPSDYLAVSGLAVATLFNLLVEKWFGLEGTANVLLATVLASVVLTGLTVILFYIFHFREPLGRSVRYVHEKTTKPLVRKVVAWPGSWRIPTALAPAAATMFTLYLFRWVVTLVLVVVMLPVYLGMMIGGVHFYRSVIEPEACGARMSASQRRETAKTEARADQSDERFEHRPYSAICIQVETKDHDVFAGRRVIATDDTVVLFKPNTGVILMVPRKDSIITFIDKL